MLIGHQFDCPCCSFPWQPQVKPVFSHLDHPVDVWFGPPIRSFAGQLEGLPLLHRLGDRGLLLEVVQDGRAHEHRVRRRRPPLVLRKAHVLAWTKGGSDQEGQDSQLVFTLDFRQ